jgi:hypothetical protein
MSLKDNENKLNRKEVIKRPESFNKYLMNKRRRKEKEKFMNKRKLEGESLNDRRKMKKKNNNKN